MVLRRIKFFTNSSQRAISGTGWAIQTHTDGRRYYYHKATRETTWSVPEDVQRIVDQAKQNQPPQRPPRTLPRSTTVAPIATNTRSTDVIAIVTEGTEETETVSVTLGATGRISPSPLAMSYNSRLPRTPKPRS
jgi:hypothetical protein